jgi:threonine/homoserine/homoserine lactone efflux protein
MPSHLLPYLVAVAVITVTPGADTALVVRNAISRGTRAATGTALGSGVGLLIWGIASATGIAAVLAASATAFTMMKTVGAIYLIYLGVKCWRHAGSELAAPGTADPRSTFRQGLLTNLTNPKAALFFTALLPQFIAPEDPAGVTPVAMTLIAAAASAAWLSLCGCVIPHFGNFLARTRVRRSIDRCTGTVLIGLGVRVALERR